MTAGGKTASRQELPAAAAGTSAARRRAGARARRLVALGALGFGAAAISGATPGGDAAEPAATAVPGPCGATNIRGPEYYRFPMVSTRRVPGTAAATGTGEVAFSASPFGVALGEDGSYEYDFALRFERLRLPPQGVFVVWTATPALDQVAVAGPLEDPGIFKGSVAWNKFLVVITLEPEFDPGATAWTGPVVVRGMSRSGMMHTMAGHGAFEQENCAAYGYE